MQKYFKFLKNEIDFVYILKIKNPDKNRDF